VPQVGYLPETYVFFLAGCQRISFGMYCPS